jgi:hypothetical protein
VTDRKVTASPISLDLPAGWALASMVLVAPKSDTLALKTAKVAPSYRANVAVQMEPSRGRTPAQLAATSRQTHERETQDYAVVDEHDVTVDGRPGLLREQTLIDAMGFHVVQLELYATVDERRVVHALASAHRGEGFESAREQLRALLLGLRLT